MIVVFPDHTHLLFAILFGTVLTFDTLNKDNSKRKISEYNQEIPQSKTSDKLQTNPWYHEEEPHNNHEAKQSALSSSLTCLKRPLKNKQNKVGLNGKW